MKLNCYYKYKFIKLFIIIKIKWTKLIKNNKTNLLYLMKKFILYNIRKKMIMWLLKLILKKEEMEWSFKIQLHSKTNLKTFKFNSKLVMWLLNDIFVLFIKMLMFFSFSICFIPFLSKKLYIFSLFLYYENS